MGNLIHVQASASQCVPALRRTPWSANTAPKQCSQSWCSQMRHSKKSVPFPPCSWIPKKCQWIRIDSETREIRCTWETGNTKNVHTQICDSGCEFVTKGAYSDLPLLCRCEDWCEVGGWACASYNKSSLRSWAGEGVNGWIPSVEAISTNVWASCNGTDKDTKTSDRFQLPWWLGKCCENLWKWSLHEIL